MEEPESDFFEESEDGVGRGGVSLPLRTGGGLLVLAVVRVVEARPLEVHRHRVEHPLNRRAVLLAGRERVVGHALHHLERVPSLAAILVDRHGTLSIGVPDTAASGVAEVGTTGSVARAPSTALRAAALASMSAIGFMGPSVALIAINLNHEFDVLII